jgi:hypothetical protein
MPETKPETEVKATRRVEFTEAPSKPWPDFTPVKGGVYDLSPDQAARAVKRGIARYLDEAAQIQPVADGEANQARKAADKADAEAGAAEDKRLADIRADNARREAEEAAARVAAQEAADRQAAEDRKAAAKAVTPKK